MAKEEYEMPEKINEPIHVNNIEEIKMVMEETGNYFPKNQESEKVFDIPFFGSVVKELRQVRSGETIEFHVLARKFGWASALVRNANGEFIILVQPKPATLGPVLEFPAGGIGSQDKSLTKLEIIDRTSKFVLAETGYKPRTMNYLGHSLIETGKEFDPFANENEMEFGSGRGVKAHLIFMDQAELIQEPQISSTDIIRQILVSKELLFELVRNNVLRETSAINCFTLALMQGLI